MKRKNKFLALLLAATMSFSVSACGSADSADTGKQTAEDNGDSSKENTDVDVFAAAQEKMKSEKISSLTGKMVMDMEMTISADGETQTMKAANTMDMTCFYDPTRFKMDMTVDAGESGTSNMTMYADTAEDGTCTLYISDGTNWQAQEVELTQIEQYDAASNMTGYMQDSYEFQDAGTEQIDGKNARKYTGTLKGDDLKETVMSTGALDSLNSLGMDTTQVESMFNDLGDLPINLWIDETDLVPVKYEMDMTSLMSKLMANTLEAMGSEAEGVSMEFNKLHVVMTCSDYNSAEEFEIPEEAKAAKPAA
ncbi:MAG: hypothetical protein HFH33_01165 [Eubacterium sp.]|jgi:hypothetical protein|nr:hypothetical protein [Eubacterium sp.]